ncbi:MAG: hypothetical protein WBA42_09335 [Mesorhizobium sp.]
MTTSYLLAVDAGTGSGRAVIFDTDGNQIASAQQEWWHKTDPRFPGVQVVPEHGSPSCFREAAAWVNRHRLSDLERWRAVGDRNFR